MRDELMKIVGVAIEAATKAGASDASAGAYRSRSVAFQVRNARLEQVNDSTSRALSMRLFVDGRYSEHTTTDLRAERVTAFVTEAVKMTRALQADPHRRLADPARYPTTLPALDLADPTVQRLDREQRLAWAMRMNERVAGKPQVISSTSSVSDGHTVVAGATTNGLSASYEATSIGLSTDATLEDGDKRPEDWMGAWGHHVADLPDPDGIADEALRLARAGRGTTKGPTKRTAWRGKLDQALVSPKLTIVDDPLVPRGLGSRPFDGEGMASARLPLIDGGALRNLYLDTYYASKLGLTPTTGQGSNRIVALGTKGRDALLKDAGTGIYVTSWLGGNMDPTTGDFSLGVRGHLFDKGQLGAPVGEMNVTGNILDLFAKLAAVGDDPWLYSGTVSPTLVFDGVQFSGA
jgi:PmbA protein